jgi:hypothetical protein
MVGAMPGLALATSLGPWQKIGNSTGQSNNEVSLLRTPDQRLHVSWMQPGSGGTSSLWHLSIPPNGGIGGGATTIVSDWASLSGGALQSAPNGSLEAFVDGIQATNPGNPNTDMNLLTSTDGGQTWSLQSNGDIVAPGAAAYSSPVAVGSVSSTPLETWFETLGVYVHSGTSATTPNTNYQGTSCCGYSSNIAANSSGSSTLAWYSNASGNRGVWAAGVNADGTPQSTPIRMPGTSDMQVGETQRTPLIATPDGDFYIAYPTGWPSFTAVKLWKVGAGTTTTITGLRTIGTSAFVSVAVDSVGRVWVLWATDTNDKAQVYATRSNTSVTKFGAVVKVGAPERASGAFSVDGNATNGALDLFSTVAIGTASTASVWYRHVYPGLTVSVSPENVRAPHRKHGATVPERASIDAVVDVNDAGVPIKGATVKLGGHVLVTDRTGHASVKLRVGGSLTVTASLPGYVDGTTKLRFNR